MFKKIVCNVALIMALMLSVFMFSSCVVPDVPDNGLAAYKSAVQAELEAYAEEKGEDNYTAENWAAIQELVADGKTAVDAAADRAGVDAAVAAAKEAMDAVWRLGTFYSLQEAYDEGLLTYDDIRSIAYYHNGGIEYLYDGPYSDFGPESIWVQSSPNYVPIPKNPEILSEAVERNLKESWAYNYRSIYQKNATIEDFKILEYYGIYNQRCYALMIVQSPGIFDASVWYVVVADVLFVYSNGNRITIWKEN